MNKRIAPFFSLILFLSITACSLKLVPIMPIADKSDNFMIGIIQVKSVGEYILWQEDLLLYPAFTSNKPIVFPKLPLFSLSPLPANIKLKKVYEYEDGSYYCEPIPERAILNVSATPQRAVCPVIDSTGSMKGFTYCYKPGHPFKSEKYAQINFQNTTIPTLGSMRKEIIYNGKTQDTIKMVYREFKDDLARPAFYQDLVYDLSESKIIAFKGTKIEVIEASNSIIRYKVIEGNNL
jgi:hypothetical protein